VSIGLERGALILLEEEFFGAAGDHRVEQAVELGHVLSRGERRAAGHGT
jgi:hypothetical protein